MYAAFLIASTFGLMALLSLPLYLFFEVFLPRCFAPGRPKKWEPVIIRDKPRA